MPLPVAHSAAGLAGYILLRGGHRPGPSGQEAGLVLLTVFAASLADLDFLPGILIGEANRFHHGPSHSILVSLLVGLLSYRVGIRLLQDISGRRILWTCLIAVFSHLILDYFSMDNRAPFGVPLFWPFDHQCYHFEFPLFGDVIRGGGDAVSFVRSLFNANNGREIIVELCFAGIVLSAVMGWNNRRKAAIFVPGALIFLVFSILYYMFHLRSTLF